MRHLTASCWISLCIALGLQGVPAGVQAQQAREVHVKVALIHNFMVFVEWSPEVRTKNASLNVCLSPKSELREAIELLRDKPVHGRPVTVRFVEDVAEAESCQVLYIDSALRTQWNLIRKRTAGSSLLTIADPDMASVDGSIVNLIHADSRIAFEIDSMAARDANLVVSSKLLRLARKVY